MEELKILVTMVASLPSMALWVIAFFFVYKVAVVGSIYGVIRYVTGRIHDVLVTKKAAVVEYKEIRPMLDGIAITGTVDSLITQISRLKRREHGYIHDDDIQRLRSALDDMFAKEKVGK